MLRFRLAFASGQRLGNEMLSNDSEIHAECLPVARGKARLLTLDAMDGRTVAARRARELARGFEAELGGPLTVSQPMAVERAAALTALAEDAPARRLAGDVGVSLEDIVRTTNIARRAVKELGIKPAAAATPPLPTIKDYVSGLPPVAAAAPPRAVYRRVRCRAMDDPNLFGPWFPGTSWDGWRTVLKGAYALPMSTDEVTFFRSGADRAPPLRRVRELWVIAGRRAGKDSVASLIGTFTAACSMVAAF